MKRADKKARAFRHKMCGRKKAFPTKGKAEFKALMYGLSFYQCPFCHCFHLTKKKQ